MAGPVSPEQGSHRWCIPRNGHDRSLRSEFHTPSVSQRTVERPQAAKIPRFRGTGGFRIKFVRPDTPGIVVPPSAVERIPYAERILATSREGPMVSFDHRPARTNWLPALPGDRSGGFCSPYGSRNLPVTSLPPGAAGLPGQLPVRI